MAHCVDPMRTEDLLSNPTILLGYLLAVAVAVVVGYFIGQGWEWQILIIATMVAMGWILYFLEQPANALIVIVCIKALTDRVDYPIVGPFTINALLYCAVLGGGVAYWVLNHAAIRNNNAGRAYFLFCLYGCWLTLEAPDRSEAMGSWVREGAMFMLYLLFANLMMQKKEQRKYIGLMCAIAVIGTFLSLAQQAGLYPHFLAGRYSGTFGHPNFFAYFLLIPIGLTCSFLMLSPSWKVRLVCLGLTPLYLLGLVLTYTRGAWIACGVMFLLLGLLARKWWFLVAVAISAVVVYSVTSSVQERLYWIVEDPNISAGTAGRSEIWLGNLPLIQKQPVVGYGLQSFIFYSPFQNDAHNSYLKMQFEGGVIGLVLYCVFLFGNVVIGFRAWRAATDPFERALMLALFCSFVSLLIGGLWENLFLGQGTEWFSYSAAGIMAALALRLRQSTAVRSNQHVVPGLSARTQRA